MSGHGGRVYTLASGKHQSVLRELVTGDCLHDRVATSVFVSVTLGKNTLPSSAIFSYTCRTQRLTDFGLKSPVVCAPVMAPPRARVRHRSAMARMMGGRQPLDRLGATEIDPWVPVRPGPFLAVDLGMGDQVWKIDPGHGSSAGRCILGDPIPVRVRSGSCVPNLMDLVRVYKI